MLKKIIRQLKTNPILAPALFLIDLLLFCTDFFATLGYRKIHLKNVCIIKLDKLGDYILIRNFLYEIRKCESYQNQHFTFIGNVENKIFADYLDANLFDKFIWIDIYKYSINLFYRFKTSKQIHREGFETAIVPTYARVLVLDDFIAHATKANKIIGQRSHLINIKKWELLWGNKFYTSVLEVSNKIIFEFERNRLFFEKLTGENLSEVTLEINYQTKEDEYQNKYVVILPGAADKFREWPAEYFSKVSEYLTIEKELQVILCGSPSEQEISETILIQSSQNGKIINKTGALNVNELFNTLYHAEFIVSNETGAVHVAAALNKTVFCISNGNHFIKYTEYPEGLKKNVYYIYPDEMDKLFDDKDKTANRFDFKSDLDIKVISAEMVRSKIENELKKGPKGH